MHIEAYGRTETGPVRENNEDSLLLDTELGVFVVADGMGGHAAGEVASEAAVACIRAVLSRSRDPDETRLVRTGEEASSAALMRERLRYAMNQASSHVRRLADERPELRGMGTTVVVLVVDGDHAHVAHVGDSRAYRIREGRIERLTRDHTVVQQEIDAGRLAPELARYLPQRNILTQSVGYGGAVEPDTCSLPLQPGDTFVLCSDGVTDALDDSALLQAVLRHPAEALADALAEAALDAGATDNVTVAVVAAT